MGLKRLGDRKRGMPALSEEEYAERQRNLRNRLENADNHNAPASASWLEDYKPRENSGLQGRWVTEFGRKVWVDIRKC